MVWPKRDFLKRLIMIKCGPRWSGQLLVALCVFGSVGGVAGKSRPELSTGPDDPVITCSQTMEGESTRTVGFNLFVHSNTLKLNFRNFLR